LTINERRRFLAPAVLAAGAFAIVQLLYWIFPAGIDVWNEQWNDRLLSLRASYVPSAAGAAGRIVHVDLNNTSLKALQDYHPSRAHHARVVRNLSAMGVALTMYDFIFAGRTAAEDDRQIMDAVRQSRRIILGMAFRLAAPGEPAADPAEAKEAEAEAYLEKTVWRLPGAAKTPQLFSGRDPLITFPELAELSQGSGFLTLTPDRDGVVRRLPLMVRFENAYYPSFALQAVCTVLNVPPERVALGPGAITLKGVSDPAGAAPRDIAIPVDGNGCMRINFVGPWGTLKHYNFADIYRASEDSDRRALWRRELSGKIVLVSDTATGSADLGVVPLDESYPLSGVHSNAVATILGERFIRELSPAKTAAVELLLLLAAVLLSFHRSAAVFSVGVFCAAGIFLSTAGLALFYASFLIPIVRPLLTVFLAWAGLLTLNAVSEARARAQSEKAMEIAEKELEIGRKIQAGFLPSHLPAASGWEFAAYFQPARQVSGDFYDVFELAGARAAVIVIADVCDHGVGSALFMALTRSLIRAFVLQNAAARPAAAPFSKWSRALALDTVRQTNEYICSNHGEAGMFATLFIGILDLAHGALTYVNGGHEPPLFLRQDEPPALLKTTGLAVGALPGTNYQAGSAAFAPGDRLLLYTDGVTEAQDRSGAYFSRNRLAELAAGEASGAQALVDAIVAALTRHAGSAACADDVTLVAIRRPARG
jgi:serine phosphatase RsbU (regulator of sigma subunit)/CHASE2 domain-containing sensor protein